MTITVLRVSSVCPTLSVALCPHLCDDDDGLGRFSSVHAVSHVTLTAAEPQSDSTLLLFCIFCIINPNPERALSNKFSYLCCGSSRSTVTWDERTWRRREEGGCKLQTGLRITQSFSSTVPPFISSRFIPSFLVFVALSVVLAQDVSQPQGSACTTTDGTERTRKSERPRQTGPAIENERAPSGRSPCFALLAQTLLRSTEERPSDGRGFSLLACTDVTHSMQPKSSLTFLLFSFSPSS